MIEVDNLCKDFKVTKRQRKVSGSEHDRILAVDTVSFRCKPGRVFSLLGANGAGKTTTLRLIATMLKPTSGRVRVNGYDVVDQSKAVRSVLGFLTGSTGLYDRLNVDELLKYYADLHGVGSVLFQERKERIYSQLDMHSFAKRRISKLSAGMRQKVSIARTIIHDPDVIVFDEPTLGLDVITARNIIQLIRDFREQGKTVIFSTHIMGEVSMLSDDLAIIHNGRLCYDGCYDDFTANMKTKTLEDEFIRIVEEQE